MSHHPVQSSLIVEWPRKQQRVRFAHTTSVIFCDSQMSAEERAASWYTNEELTDLRVECRETARMFRKCPSQLKSTVYCMRGLEHLKTTKHSTRRKNNKAVVINAVLSEQEITHSPEDLAVMSSMCSKFARKRAAVSGLADARAASKIQNVGAWDGQAVPLVKQEELDGQKNTSIKQPSKSSKMQTVRCSENFPSELKLIKRNTSKKIYQMSSSPAFMQKRNSKTNKALGQRNVCG